MATLQEEIYLRTPKRQEEAATDNPSQNEESVVHAAQTYDQGNRTARAEGPVEGPGAEQE